MLAMGLEQPPGMQVSMKRRSALKIFLRGTKENEQHKPCLQTVREACDLALTKEIKMVRKSSYFQCFLG
jgi:hypothetical protein